MDKQGQERRGSLVFAVNGERFELSTVDPSTTLLEFLRCQTRFKSVKLGCGEGGCGACVVLLSKYDSVLNKIEDLTISSCLTLVCSLNGCSITTTEGLGNHKDGFHPIHQRLAGFHASQCGFCTPGMCVSLFSALVNAEKKNRPEPDPGFSKLTVSEAEKAISGNLCRCTGYRSIADASKSFASDVDIEDLGFNSFWKKSDSKELKISQLPLYNQGEESCSFPEFLKKQTRSDVFVDPKGYCWYNPGSIKELQVLLDCNDPNRGKLVVGNTGVSYYKEFELFDWYINLKNISELSYVRKDRTRMEIGAAVTIAKAIEALKKENKSEVYPMGELVFKKIANHMERIASGFVRNSASVGGNLVMAQRKQFPSDIATIFLAADSEVEILSGSCHEKIILEEFLERPPLDYKSILLNIKIPNFESVRKSSPEADSVILFETYRAAPRPLGNTLPYLNAAFLAVVSPNETSDGIMVNWCHLAFGGYGTKHAVRAKNVENFLSGKVLSKSVLYEAIKVLGSTVVPEKGTSSPAYRTSLATGFLFEFFSPLLNGNVPMSKSWLGGYNNPLAIESCKSNEGDNQFGHNYVDKILSSSKQVIQLSKEYYPVGEPITKSGAATQASGEAVYVDDIPSPKDCLHGSIVYSTKPMAEVKDVRFPTLHTDGVVSVLSFKDIPECGENIGAKTIFGDEPLFADEFTQSAGQIIAFVVADSQKQANMAANCAVVDYDVTNVETPILSVEDAVDRLSFFEIPSLLYPKQVGDTLKGMAQADQRILSAQVKLGSQYYFYMETQTALAVPDEENCMVVYSSTQCPQFAHTVIAKCLGIPEHSVCVITRRVGGGFGGKAIKSIPIATACALAAHKLRRPVRIYLDRKTDMIMAGGRHPMKITYNVGFKSNGKITALELNILIDAGMSCDISPIMPHNILGALKKYDWGALSFDIKLCKTNCPSRSAMRGPGELQGSYIAEAVIENVASTLSMEVDLVRRMNFHSNDSLNLFYEGSAGEPQEYTLPSIWDKLAMSSSFDQRRERVDEFNRCNIWRKRSLSRVPIVHPVLLRPTPGKVSILSDGSVVVEVGGIELGQGLWTKVRQMAAYALSKIHCSRACDLLEKVRVIQSDTLSLIQGGFTAGSTTSESSCEAVRLSCNTLVERLFPLKEMLQGQMDSLNWEVLISQAYLQSVNLSASSLYVPEFTSMSYLNYGAAVSEVEVNLVTGETTILRSDIIYDCGQSLNPAVDLGQIEGAFIQGVGFFMSEEYLTNSDGLVVTDSTWNYKIPTIDTIPKEFNVEILNSGHHENRVLSSKASGEPPLLLAASVHCATRAAIREARKQLRTWSNGDLSESGSQFELEVPATMAVVKELCGLDIVEKYMEHFR